MLFSFFVYQFSQASNKRIIHLLLYLIIINVSAQALIANHNSKSRIFHQELKPILAHVEPSDQVFLYFSAQPGYNWYKLTLYPDILEPMNRVNTTTGLLIDLGELKSNLDVLINETGAWSTLATLTNSDTDFTYEHFLADKIIRAGESKVIGSHRTGEILIEILTEKCQFDYIEQQPGAWIANVDCTS